MVRICVGDATHPVSDRLYGVFFEDINLSADGGLNANMVNNYSFDGVYLDHHTLRLAGGERWRTQADPLRFWRFEGCAATSCGSEIRGEHGQRVPTDCPAPPLHRHSRYARVSVPAGANAATAARIENLGYNGGGAYAGRCAMAVQPGRLYEFAAWVRPVTGEATLRVCVVDRYGLPLTDVGDIRCDAGSGRDADARVDARVDASSVADARVTKGTGGWRHVRFTLRGVGGDYGKLRIDIVNGAACEFDLDCVELMDAEYWGAGDPKWRHGKLRRDMVESIAALKPAFLRFPGGCIVEGVTPGNEYRWKDTVGALAARRQQYSIWAFKTPDGSSYSQSYQIGFYEYFCLCEDLGAKPLPTLFAGIACQSPGRDPRHMPTDARAFRSNVVQDYLDLIEFANGDPDTSAWAAVRRDMGHPEPFGLDMVGVGNENFGPDYLEKFDIISRAIHERYPDMLCVMSAGLFPFKPTMRRSWEHARRIADQPTGPAASGSARIATAQEGLADDVAPRDGHRGCDGGLLPAIGSATGDAVIVDEHSYHSPEWFIAQATRFDGYPRDGAGVYFGEYSANGYFAGQPQKPETANTWRTALAEAAFLTGCERNSDVVRMTSYAPLFAHATAKGWEQNLIEFNASHMMPSVNYEMARLFAGRLGATAYACEVGDVVGGGDERPSGPVDMRPQRDLFVSATGDDPSAREGTTFVRYIKMVNTGARSINATLDVSRGLRALGAKPATAEGDDAERNAATGPTRGTLLEIDVLHADPGDRNTLGYEGEGHGLLSHTHHESRLAANAGKLAVSLRPYSVTVVTLRG
ncbi:alpha-L-arabinofuranosidase C-terminal domain-containing protein [Bifidobacterium eulemuris]|uniref:non-reducing end alpha-L-arabinofuranosidase n=1 Tax=Bifidobacterium eulemuris TaxID=1765219 RepID=A0A7L9SNS2_9BIFI|nr:alpha-L-arabinofuranosidase C-terminal domain-containing protein [Bifidobacterium eulemuris]QOL31782.1 alpha-L-arabinofuranosidase [Bifidobacterium eulemuris]